MKILIIMAGYFPGKKYGGPPVSVDNFCSLMKEDDCYIVTRCHDRDETKNYVGIDIGKWTARDNCRVMYLTDELYCMKTFRKIIIKLKPDILYLQGFFQECVLPCLQLAKKYRLNVLLAPRGEFCSGAFKKKYKKLPYIYCLMALGLLKNVFFQSTSDEETESIKRYLRTDANKIIFLTNISLIPKKKYKRVEKIAGEGRFVFLSRIHPKKNLISAIKYFNGVQGKAILDIYGPLEDEAYWMECQQEIQKLPDNVTVNYCGLVSHDKVHEVFSKYDAFIFPTFSENYGHVIAEALLVGTPVIIGKGSTPWDDIDGVAGYIGDLSNEKIFSVYLNNIISLNGEEHRNLTKSAKNYIENKLNLIELQSDYKKAIAKVVFMSGA